MANVTGRRLNPSRKILYLIATSVALASLRITDGILLLIVGATIVRCRRTTNPRNQTFGPCDTSEGG